MSALEEEILKKDIGNCFPLSLGHGKFGSGIWDMLITSHSGNFMPSSWPLVNVCKGSVREWWLRGWKFLTLKWLLLQMFAAVLRASKYLMYQCSLDSNPCFRKNVSWHKLLSLPLNLMICYCLKIYAKRKQYSFIISGDLCGSGIRAKLSWEPFYSMQELAWCSSGKSILFFFFFIDF